MEEDDDKDDYDNEDDKNNKDDQDDKEEEADEDNKDEEEEFFVQKCLKWLNIPACQIWWG